MALLKKVDLPDDVSYLDSYTNENIVTVKLGEHPYIEESKKKVVDDIKKQFDFGETVTVKGTLSAFEGVATKDIDAIVGNSDLMDEINKLVLNDTRDAYIRELLNQNRELRAEVKEANKKNEKLKQMRADVIEYIKNEQTEERFVGGTCDGDKYYVLYHSDYLLTLLEAEDE